MLLVNKDAEPFINGLVVSKVLDSFFENFEVLRESLDEDFESRSALEDRTLVDFFFADKDAGEGGALDDVDDEERFSDEDLWASWSFNLLILGIIRYE